MPVIKMIFSYTVLSDQFNSHCMKEKHTVEKLAAPTVALLNYNHGYYLLNLICLIAKGECLYILKYCNLG